ncbi:MAG: hypothetical protein JSV74_04535 [Dehalococcoidia bacterium]|nr:MAG: hypothetical protein JSV74_04535 [Dehalococcoidia bacterium]
MSSKIFRLKIAATLITVICLIIVLLSPSPIAQSTTSRIDQNSVPLIIKDFSGIPQHVINSAGESATVFFGNDQQKNDEYVAHLLAIYLAAHNKDIVIINNSGGWGWSPLENFPNSQEFVAGIDNKLNSLGYDTLWLDHYRTTKTINGCVSELMFAADLYPTKVEDLIIRVEFLINHIPNLRVILSGESNGSTICGEAMQVLKDNPQVYCIQLGPPFWNDNTKLDRMLVLRSNGSIPDAFSQGDIMTIIRTNFETLLGISQEYPGHVLFYIGAPGHDYRWQYEGVSSPVLAFLDYNFNHQKQ